MTTATENLTCLNQVNSGRWCQESYETATRAAAKRTKQLRAAGYAVVVGSMGSQVTPLGTIKMTMVDIRPGIHADTFGLPEVEKICWPRR